MAKTINFCGDSFCANQEAHSWTHLLCDYLNATMLGQGRDATAHEHAIQTFNPSADITIFCWTESHRLYHPKHGITLESCDRYRKTFNIYEAGYQFYRYLHDSTYFRQRQKRDLYWFDHEVLSQYSGISISLWSFEKTYEFTHSHNFDLPPLKTFRDRATGEINHMNESMNTLLAKKIFNYIRSLHG